MHAWVNCIRNLCVIILLLVSTRLSTLTWIYSLNCACTIPNFLHSNFPEGFKLDDHAANELRSHNTSGIGGLVRVQVVAELRLHFSTRVALSAALSPKDTFQNRSIGRHIFAFGGRRELTVSSSVRSILARMVASKLIGSSCSHQERSWLRARPVWTSSAFSYLPTSRPWPMGDHGKIAILSGGDILSDDRDRV